MERNYSAFAVTFYLLYPNKVDKSFDKRIVGEYLEFYLD